MRTPPEMGVRWPKQARHTSQMDRLRMRGEELAVAAPARPSGRDGVMASPSTPRWRWLLESGVLEGAGAVELPFTFQHVLTASMVSHMTNPSTAPLYAPYAYDVRAWTDGQAIYWGGAST